MRDIHQAAAAQWNSQQANRPAASLGTGRERRKRLWELRREMRRENALKEKPDPVCKRCGVVHLKEDAGWLFKKRCGTCDVQAIERLVLRIMNRHGRRQTIRLLRRLARD